MRTLCCQVLLGGGNYLKFKNFKQYSLWLIASSGDLFAKCPVDSYPGMAVEGVLDSSRYFVLKIVNDSGEWFSIRVVMVTDFL